ncbi:MAG: class I SAM-dependent methyltransferase [Vulcanimicrobiota bacterium]
MIGWFLRQARTILAGYRRVRGWLRSQAVRRELSTLAGLSFTQDYLKPWLPNWDVHLRPLQPRHILEIGSFEGRSACWFLEAFPHSHLTCVDPFYDDIYEQRFEHNVRRAGGEGRVTRCKGRSEAILPTLAPESYDLIYIDGSHKAVHVLFDALMGLELLRPGGVMVFDDYLWCLQLPSEDRPQLAIDFFLKQHPELQVLYHGYQVMVRKPN